MIEDITKSDVFWSYLGKLFQIASGLFLLPLILRELPSYQIGIWYIFQSITALVNLLDFGMQPIIMRNVSYIFAGAKELKKEGTAPFLSDLVDYKLLVDFIKSVKLVYMIISLLAFVLLLTIGTSYVKSVSADFETNEILISWFIYAVSATLTLYYYYYSPLLVGQGKIKESNKSMVYSRCINLLVSFALLYLGYGLLAIAIANFVGSITSRFFSRKYLNNPEFINNTRNINARLNIGLLRVIWYNSRKMSVISISYFLMTRASTLLVGNFLPLSTVASYGLTVQLFDILVGISTILVVVYSPKLNVLSYKMKNTEFIEYSGLIIISSLFLFTIGSTFIVYFGNFVLILFGTSVRLLNAKEMSIIALSQFLGINYSVLCQIISTKNVIPYEKASAFSGIGIIVLTYVALKYTSLGIYGVVMTPLIVQSIYNYWKWPLYFMKQYQTSYQELFRVVIVMIYNKFKGAIQ